MFKKLILSNFGRLALAAAVVMAPSFAAAAGAGATGIDASFTTMLGDLNTMLGGNFGALMLLVSLIIGIGVYAVTSNWKWVISSVMIAFLIGYGVDIINGIGGVTATVDMLTAASEVPSVTLDGAGPV
ncbi:MAG: hypothetical protein AAFR98_07165 [Pseudomonadota bacterium]